MDERKFSAAPSAEKETISPEEEINQICAEVSQKLNSLDVARQDPMLGAADKVKANGAYDSIAHLKDEAEIISDPEVQHVAKECASYKPEEITAGVADADGRMSEIMIQTKENGGKVTPEQQKRLDELRKRKNGLLMTKMGGLRTVVANFKEKMKQSGM